MFHPIFPTKKDNKQSTKQTNTLKNKITIDNREKSSLVPSELAKLNFHIEFTQLDIGDYIINNTAIERKTISDLKNSIINKRIFQQFANLIKYESRMLIIEGLHSELFNDEILSRNAIKGFLQVAQLEYKIPIIFSKNEADTALNIELIAKRKKTEISLFHKKPAQNKEQQRLFILQSFPGIGPKSASILLKKFKSLEKIFNASEEDLKIVLGKKSADFYNLVH